MDAGKTHTVVSVIRGLRRQGYRVAGVKLTGTATGKDTWKMLDNRSLRGQRLVEP